MINIKVIASGSSGNCTVAETTAGEKFLFDAGIAYSKIVRAAGYVDYAIITHEHSDHAYKSTPTKLLENGTNLYMTKGTCKALGLGTRHNLTILYAGIFTSYLRLGSCQLRALKSRHDAAEPIVFQLYDGEDRVLYATDTKYIPEWIDEENVFTKLVVEANHFEKVLAASRADEWHKMRVSENHLSVERLRKYLIGLNKEKLKEVHLIHISKRNGDGNKFRKIIGEIVNVPVFAY